jgi:hypothetical protein
VQGRHRHRHLLGLLVGLALATPAPAGPLKGAGFRRNVDPAQVLPLEQIPAQSRDAVAEVIREHHFHRQGKPDTFPANPKLYLGLLNDPALTLALWQDVYPTPARLRPISPGVFQGDDGNGATATWEFLVRSPRLNVLFCKLNYTSPRGATRLDGRLVLIVRSGYYREVNGEPWIRHDIEAFVKVDSRGWRAVAATARPIIEKLLEDQIQEAGWFVSLMARMVEMYPNWATEVTLRQQQLPQETREGFRDLVAQTRRPGALPGRPQFVAQGNTSTTRR